MPGKYTLTGRRAEVAKKMMKNITQVFNNNEIPYILDAGTLLGITRENRLLPWDNDVDITVTRHFEDKVMNCLNQIRRKGYRVRVKHYSEDLKNFKKGELRIIKIKNFSLLTFKSDVVVDIFLKKQVGDNYYWTVAVKNPVLKSCPIRFYDEIKKVNFDNTEYTVPEDNEGYLAYHYGEDWRVPIKSWDFRVDDNCNTEFL